MIKNFKTGPERGFALLVAVVLTSVLLSVGLALLDIAYKQVILSSTARQSQYSFYAADSAMECALYADQVLNVFRFDFPGTQGNDALNVRCGGADVSNYQVSQSGVTRKTSFEISCPGGGMNGYVEVYKTQDGTTNIYANGYNTCTLTDPRRIERGLKVYYAGSSGQVPTNPGGGDGGNGGGGGGTPAPVTYAWESGSWGSCSSGGQQTRTVTCRGSNGSSYPDGQCTGTKPSATQSCTPPPAACTFNGQAVMHGDSVTAYTAATVPYSTSCSAVAQTRTCTNGTLSGTATNPSCTVAALPRIDMQEVITSFATNYPGMAKTRSHREYWSNGLYEAYPYLNLYTQEIVERIPIGKTANQEMIVTFVDGPGSAMYDSPSKPGYIYDWWSIRSDRVGLIATIVMGEPEYTDSMTQQQRGDAEFASKFLALFPNHMFDYAPRILTEADLTADYRMDYHDVFTTYYNGGQFADVGDPDGAGPEPAQFISGYPSTLNKPDKVRARLGMLDTRGQIGVRWVLVFTWHDEMTTDLPYETAYFDLGPSQGVYAPQYGYLGYEHNGYFHDFGNHSQVLFGNIITKNLNETRLIRPDQPGNYFAF